MKLHAPRLRRSFRTAGAGVGLLLLAACGGGDSQGDISAKPEDVDQDASATVTEKELARFEAPADSVLTAQQVEAYIKTTLLQFDLINKEAPKMAERAKQMEERGKDGGVLAGLRNVAEGGQLMVEAGNLIGGSYVRSARTLGYNPAELEWVRERMGEVSGYLMAKPMMASQVEMAKQMRAQAEQYRGQAGFTEEQVQQMITTADEMEKSVAENSQVARSVQRNYEVLRGFRSNVTDPMWMAISISGGTAGLLGLNWADPQDAEAQKKLTEFRQVFTDALANKVSPGMENPQPAS